MSLRRLVSPLRLLCQMERSAFDSDRVNSLEARTASGVDCVLSRTHMRVAELDVLQLDGIAVGCSLREPRGRGGKHRPRKLTDTEGHSLFRGRTEAAFGTIHDARQ